MKRIISVLHTEVSECVPLFYVYYSAGKRTSARTLWSNLRTHARLHAVCVAHAHLVAPALCAALVTAFRDGVDYRIVKGVMLWSRGGGCAWLSLALSAHAAAPSVAAFVYLAALLVAPLATALICGQAAMPPLWSVLHTLTTTAAPFVAGVIRGAVCRGADTIPAAPASALRLCALALLYAECCERLSDSEGILHVSDVLITLTLELCAVGAVAATSTLYPRCGLLAPGAARLVTLCALPRALDTRWEPGEGCATAGLARLPAVFLAPAQALLLAALVPHDQPSV
ncbi:unnamed protein product [Arctia plantaginis]|uniref:Uncharacterized protein n=1 Tax=Arctia plantaginis TaxID=874455 RepID=A0A8S1BEX9_ARCPL|nr:unnamed protein product [Arctia plantaginis]